MCIGEGGQGEGDATCICRVLTLSVLPVCTLEVFTISDARFICSGCVLRNGGKKGEGGCPLYLFGVCVGERGG